MQQQRMADVDLTRLSNQNKLLKQKVSELELWVEELTHQNQLQLNNLAAEQSPLKNFINNQNLIDQYLQENNKLRNQVLEMATQVTQKEEALRSSTFDYKTQVKQLNERGERQLNKINDLEINKELLLKSKQKFVMFVKSKILQKIKDKIAAGNQMMIDQEIQNYEANEIHMFHDILLLDSKENTAHKKQESIHLSEFGTGRNNNNDLMMGRQMSIEEKPLFSQQFADFRQNLSVGDENLTDEDENHENGPLNYNTQFEPRKSNKDVKEYNLNINLDHILPSAQISPQTEAIFRNFGDSKSIDIRNMNNSESQRQLEHLMIQSNRQHKRQINELNTAAAHLKKKTGRSKSKGSKSPKKTKPKSNSKSRNEVVKSYKSYGSKASTLARAKPMPSNSSRERINSGSQVREEPSH